MEVFIIATENSALLRELLKSVKYMVDTSISEAPYDRTVVGLVAGGASKKKYYNVTIQGKTYELPSYINNTIKPNTTVNVMIPQNNMDFAFIYSIFGGEEKGTGGGGSGGHADTADYATTAGYANTVAVATETVVGGLLSSTGKNHVTISPTGIATVTDVSHADNADNANNAVNATNALNATHADKADSADVADTVKNVPVATNTKVGGIKSGTGIGVVNVADDGTATVELPPEPDPYVLPIATDTVLGGIYSSTGPGHVVVNPDGTAVVPDAGGIKEIPIATTEEVGGVLSSEESGKLNVNSKTGVSTINDVVLIDESGRFTKPEEWGEGPWELVCTEDNSLDINNGLPRGGTTGQYLTKTSDEDFDVEWSTLDLSAENITYNNSTSGMVAQNVQKAVDELNTRDNSISQQVSTNTSNISSLDSQVSTNTQDITENAANIALHHTEIIANTNGISTINNRIQYYSNKNLLDNWYFINPINQLGKTTYKMTIDNYTIDRWMFTNGSIVEGVADECRVLSDCIEIENKSLNASVFPGISNMVNYLIPGQIYTFSELIEAPQGKRCAARIYNTTKANFASSYGDFTTIGGKQLNYYTVTIPTTWDYGDRIRVLMGGCYGSGIIKFYAAKLELGSQQTLAHQDTDGNWILNDAPPNYEQELAKCMRYFQNLNLPKYPYAYFGNGVCRGGSCYCLIPTPVTLRILPNVSWGGNMKLFNQSDYPITSITKDQVSTNSISLRVVASGITTNNMYNFIANNDANAYIYLDANL